MLKYELMDPLLPQMGIKTFPWLVWKKEQSFSLSCPIFILQPRSQGNKIIIITLTFAGPCCMQSAWGISDLTPNLCLKTV